MWTSLSDMVSAWDADIYNKEGTGVPANEFLRCLQEADNRPEEAAGRWAVVLNDQEKLASNSRVFQLRRTS